MGAWDMLGVVRCGGQSGDAGVRIARCSLITKSLEWQNVKIRSELCALETCLLWAFKVDERQKI